LNAAIELHAERCTRVTDSIGSPSGPTRLKLALHGAAIQLDNFLPQLDAPLRRLLGTFSVPGWPERFAPVHGTVRPYDHAEVMRHLSPAARAWPRHAVDLSDVYQDGARFWLVDDRWGMAEINFLKGQWRSWVLPGAKFDPVRCAEMAVLWPLAQLLRPRGVYLLPAASAVRAGWAFLMICPFGAGAELSALIDSGYKLIGQRWTALREEDGRLALLHVPGLVQRPPGAPGGRGGWVDLNERSPLRWQNHAFCDAVLVAHPGRRAHTNLRELDPASSAALLRRAWPISELHPTRRHGPLPSKLPHLCRCADLQLSRDPAELLALLDDFQAAPAAPFAA